MATARTLSECLLPLGSSITIGVDEDFELAKYVLAVKGYRFYTEVWNDQPPLYVFLLTELVRHLSSSVLWPRLLTVGFSVILVCSVYLLTLRLFGIFAAALTAVMVISSPGFLELSCSCMQELPALAPIIASLCVVLLGRPRGRHLNEVLSGALFGIGLQMKLIGVIYLPLIPLVLWLRTRRSEVWAENPSTFRVDAASAISVHGNPQKQNRVTERFPTSRGPLTGVEPLQRPLAALLQSLAAFTVALLLVFLALNWLTGSPLSAQIRQGWQAHFARARSFEHGSPGEHPFDWSVLAKNWDTTVPAFVGFMALVLALTKEDLGGEPRSIGGGRRLKKGSTAVARIARERITSLLNGAEPIGIALPAAWLVLTLMVFPLHTPWWAYYYVHNSVPLSLCAAVGYSLVLVKVLRARKAWAIAAVGLFLACAGSWMAGRVYLQVATIRAAPRIENSLVLKEIVRFKPFTRFMFTDQPIYSFHSGIPLPPSLGVMSLKRFWAGDMTNARFVSELDAAQPELILLRNDTTESVYEEQLSRKYSLVYRDDANRLYALKSIASKASYE